MGIKKVKGYGKFANALAGTVDTLLDVKNTRLPKRRPRR